MDRNWGSERTGEPVESLADTTEVTSEAKPITEWGLQVKLTHEWAARGVTRDERRLMLVAFEVMLPSWIINDAKKRWNEPSIDFLFADRNMNLYGVELKREVLGASPAWKVLCQVTHRAALLARGATRERLESVWEQCGKGEQGRGARGDGASLQEAHRRFFELDETMELTGAVNRVVAAKRFGSSWAEVLQRFNSLSSEELIEEVRRRAATNRSREFARVLALAPEEIPRSPVSYWELGDALQET